MKSDSQSNDFRERLQSIPTLFRKRMPTGNPKVLVSGIVLRLLIIYAISLKETMRFQMNIFCKIISYFLIIAIYKMS